jgi:hypothetical protein
LATSEGKRSKRVDEMEKKKNKRQQAKKNFFARQKRFSPLSHQKPSCPPEIPSKAEKRIPPPN